MNTPFGLLPRRWWSWCGALPLLLLGLSWWAARPASAAPSDCRVEQLTGARTDASLTLRQHGQSFIRASTQLTVQVPVTWPYAKDLLLAESSSRHQHAMRCVLREEEPEAGYGHLRRDEWRVDSPRVTEGTSSVRVEYDAFSWLNHQGTIMVGPWKAVVAPGRWHLSLVPPPALKGADWGSVLVDLGGLAASDVSPLPSSDDGRSLVWHEPGAPRAPDLSVTVETVPSWQRAWAANTGIDPWHTVNLAGQSILLVGPLLVLAFAAHRARLDPAGTEAPGAERRIGGALLVWALVNAAVGVTISLLFNLVLAPAGRPLALWSQQQHWVILSGVLIGWGLTVLARPGRSVRLTATLVAIAGTLVAVRPSLFGLHAPHPPHESLPAVAFAALATLTSASLFLGLTGLVCWAWRFACEGGLLRPAANPRRLLWTGLALASVTVLMTGWALWAGDQYWQRISWLIDSTSPAYHSLHQLVLSQRAVDFAATVPTWLYSHIWVLTGFGILVLLRARDLGRPVPVANPGYLDCLLLALFFALVVAWREGSYAGSQLLNGLWLVLDVAALLILLAVGRRWAVLSQRFEGGDACALSEAVTDEAGHQDLIDRARCYRELVGELRRLEQGQDNGGRGRPDVEEELRRLHCWQDVPCAGGPVERCLPGQITVLDVALSWGPHARWWRNALLSGALAAAFGFPGSVFLVWKDYSPKPVQLAMGEDPFGVADMLWKFASWELVWAGAGLMLGALWRLLPGRRGPVRVLSLWSAYAVLIVLDIVGNHFADQPRDNSAFAMGLMLPVLTVTSFFLDTATFRAERRLWSTRFGLLLSVYQLRGLSAQIAWVLAQVGVLVLLWSKFGGFDPRSLKPPG
ncbi:DUF6185 family protein [Kitasatospora sp. HPMI-4]|uniref:DUF6185 family protein n=1 Tax=Kitasatospora sp. HPMI-4 TaxID=3448443 RepID=UPI003F1A5949